MTPFGLPTSSFVLVCAPPSSVAGYVIGRRLDSLIIGSKKLALITIMVLTTMIAVFVYYRCMEQLDPGAVANLTLYSLFVLIVGLFYAIMGMVSVKFGITSEINRKDSPRNGAVP
jgi:hypothetical protein